MTQYLSTIIDADVHKVLLTVDSNLEAQIAAFMTLAKYAAGKDIDGGKAAKLFIQRYLTSLTSHFFYQQKMYHQHVLFLNQLAL